MSLRFRLNTLWLQLMIPVTQILIRLLGIQLTIRLICNPDKFMSDINKDNLVGAKHLLRPLKVGVQQTFWKGNCLSRSIALHCLLQKNGISSALCIGVRNKPRFKAHAWVEHKGIPLNADAKVRKNYQAVEGLHIVNRANFS